MIATYEHLERFLLSLCSDATHGLVLSCNVHKGNDRTVEQMTSSPHATYNWVNVHDRQLAILSNTMWELYGIDRCGSTTKEYRASSFYQLVKGIVGSIDAKELFQEVLNFEARLFLRFTRKDAHIILHYNRENCQRFDLWFGVDLKDTQVSEPYWEIRAAYLGERFIAENQAHSLTRVIEQAIF